MTQKQKQVEKKGKKTLSHKEIFRAIALEYKQPNEINIELLGQLCSGIFYPRGLDNEGRIRYQNTFVDILRRFTSKHSDNITQQQFCLAMNDFEKFSQNQAQQNFCSKIFSRYQNQFNVIDQKGFILLAKALQIKEQQIKETFMQVCNRSNVITYDKLRQFLR